MPIVSGYGFFFSEILVIFLTPNEKKSCTTEFKSLTVV